MVLRMLDFPDQKSTTISTNPYVPLVKGQHKWAFLQDVLFRRLGRVKDFVGFCILYFREYPCKTKFVEDKIECSLQCFVAVAPSIQAQGP